MYIKKTEILRPKAKEILNFCKELKQAPKVEALIFLLLREVVNFHAESIPERATFQTGKIGAYKDCLVLLDFKPINTTINNFKKEFCIL